MKTAISGWGKYPVVQSDVVHPLSKNDIGEILSRTDGPSITRGLGRSYGDSALAANVIGTDHMDHFLRFDEEGGRLTCSAGASLSDILRTFVPKGWFLPVTPGTEFVTVGGAIAGDVHGKNHHVEGAFSGYIDELVIFVPSEGYIHCSRTRRPEVFRATCGGMGLTGVITEATVRLKRIPSAYIDETVVKAANLYEVMELFKSYAQATYSVAWIDCLSTGKSLGRSLLMLGEHSLRGDLSTGADSPIVVPVDMPSMLLNRHSVRAFNTLYYNKVLRKRTGRRIHYKPFFYPLDSILHWNRIYGKGGFTQYQFVLPKESASEGMTAILERIARSRRGSFLSVLKAFGKANDNYLSFPKEGLTLSLDFKLDRGLFSLLDELDGMVLDYGGRIYLAKDARMSEDVFKKGYPEWEQFMEVRASLGADKIFNSVQSERLGL